MSFGLSDKIVNRLKMVFAENAKVETAIIFGSRAKGNYKEGSDIDIVIKGLELNFEDRLNLMQKLDELGLPYKIDLINYYNITDLDLIDHIDRIGIMFYVKGKQKFTD
jgi:predicted nucleotidyltransferase